MADPDALKPFLLVPGSSSLTMSQAGWGSSLSHKTRPIPPSVLLGESAASSSLPQLLLEQRRSKRRSQGRGSFSASSVAHGGGASRGDLAAFLTGSRGSANVLAPPPPPRQLVTEQEEQGIPTGGGGGGGKASLEDVWRKGLFGKAAELPDLPVELIGTINPETGMKRVLRIEPDTFYCGRVRRPHVYIDEIPVVSGAEGGGTSATTTTPSVGTTTTQDGVVVPALEGGAIMHPKLRRQLHEAENNSRLATHALQEAYRARAKLARTCAKNFPYGALGVVESPQEGITALSTTDGGGGGDVASPATTAAGTRRFDFYAENSATQATQLRHALRKAKGSGVVRPSAVGAIVAGAPPGPEEAMPRRGGVKTFAPRESIPLLQEAA